jgi:hypothetical protein
MNEHHSTAQTLRFVTIRTDHCTASRSRLSKGLWERRIDGSISKQRRAGGSFCHTNYWQHVYSVTVNEQTIIIDRLELAGILDGVRWAYAAAVNRTLGDYSEAAGYDAAWLGNTRFTLFRDRLDRVFACGRYALQADADAAAGLDLLLAELRDHEMETMPKVAPHLVRRADLNHSPGWAFDKIRFLLASCSFGKIGTLPWPQRSPTKQLVATQVRSYRQPSLLDDLALDEIDGLLAIREQKLDLETFVIAHSMDPIGLRRELVLGRPRINSGGGEAWHWYQNLLSTQPQGGGFYAEEPISAGSEVVSDAPVRLRREADKARKSSGD